MRIVICTYYEYSLVTSFANTTKMGFLADHDQTNLIELGQCIRFPGNESFRSLVSLNKVSDTVISEVHSSTSSV